ncbi:tRNA uridine-5-carboxymethylaminomethyl(34) synthesis GTPase MnmE [Ruminococcus flavefaciens]|uniref:tRNA uridine-5-carboxymethylaminomethyl(34) synthesis GTPase MnmE n=1 Tax=Ruminococcus flavefaciens TaxID=1265 RepID=UPI0026F03D78|nr:tRNA uridine-5-carboxymethylaminomethyl(34) synthesis GTPase MnmE [Ruminococcus flavefaciens]
MSTIAAVSTPNAVGGIAVIRISGEDAIKVAERIFSPYGEKKVADMVGYTCAYGIAHDGDERLDDCILTVFRAPHSYTGEDIAELSCHGGLYITKRVLRAALANGAVNAEAGEFTKRAYLNGKLDLMKAEAVMDIISAKGEREMKMAENLREGAAYKKAKKCSDKMMKILGDLAAWADYPEEDIPEVRPEVLGDELREIRDDLRSLVKNYDSGRILREGVATAIIGRPNVGKSTLFNCLSGCERSIVTEIAGTTRDIIEESVRIGDITLRLSDTAGIHETDDMIEGIGVDMAEKMINSSELVIAVFDGSCPLTEDDFYLINKININNTIAVINKNDVEQVIDTSLLKDKIKHIVYLSAKESTGVNELHDCIEEIFKLSEADFGTATAANERQKKCIDKALEGIESAILSLEIGEMLDAVNIILDEAEQSLLQLTGEKVTDAVVDEVFSRFCVGK